MAKSGIHIKPSHEGLFTKKAEAAGKSVSEYAHEKEHAPGVLGQEARFAIHIGHTGEQHHASVQKHIDHAAKHGTLDHH